MSFQITSNIDKMYFSKNFFARDLLVSIAPFTLFLLIFFYYYPKHVIFTTFAEHYNFSTASFLFNLIVIISFILICIIVAELNLKFIFFFDKLIRKISLLIKKFLKNRRKNSWLYKAIEKFCNYRDTEKIYLKLDNGITELYTEVFGERYLDCLKEEKQPVQKVAVLLHYCYIFNPEGFSSCQRMSTKQGYMHQVVSYLFYFIIISIFDFSLELNAIFSLFIYFVLFIGLMIKRHTFIDIMLEVDLEYIIGTLQGNRDINYQKAQYVKIKENNNSRTANE